MSDLTLRSVADYVRTSKAPAALLAFLQSIRRVYDFAQERANRLTRYVVITRAYKAGKPVRDIETKFQCSRGTVMRYARMAEIPKRPKHLPAEIRSAIIADYKNPKLQVVEIAKLHDVSPGYVSKVARQDGISRYEVRPKKRKRINGAVGKPGNTPSS